jgi:hypothetical protein
MVFAVWSPLPMWMWTPHPRLGPLFAPALRSSRMISCRGFDVVVGEDRGDQFAFFCVRSVDAHIPLEFPNPALLVLASPAVISVLAGGVPCSGSEVLGDLSCRFFSCDVVHLDLNSDGLVLHSFNLLSCFIIHGMFSFVFSLFSLSVSAYYRQVHIIARP